MAAELPAAVIEWRDAYTAYVAAVDAYNARVHAIRERENKYPETFGRENPEAEYRAMNDAANKQYRLIPAMHASLVALGVGGGNAPSTEASARKRLDAVPDRLRGLVQLQGHDEHPEPASKDGVDVSQGVECEAGHAPGGKCEFGPYGWRGVIVCKHCKQAPPDGVPGTFNTEEKNHG